MTSNPLQPNKTGDESRTAPAVGAPSQSQNVKMPQSGTHRDEGDRSFKSIPEVASSTAPRVGGSAEVMGYLDRITEFVGKARKALSPSNQDSTSQANERQTNEGGPRAPRNESTDKPAHSSTSPV